MSTTPATEASDPREVVEAFLGALESGDVDAAVALVADDVAYTNVSLPTITGRRRLADFLRGLDRPAVAFEAHMHAISADGPVVLTERTDVISVGRVRAQFWVCGRFEVHEGRITLWRDYFDWVDIGRATVRGLVGAVVPSLRARPPLDRPTPESRRTRLG